MFQRGMPAGRKRAPLVLTVEDRAKLETIRRSRTEEHRRTVRAAILLDAAEGMTDQANAAARQVNRNTVVLCVRKYLGFGLEAALGELPRSGNLGSSRTTPLHGSRTSRAKSRKISVMHRNYGRTSCSPHTFAGRRRRPATGNSHA